jgi:hypothetical protein
MRGKCDRTCDVFREWLEIHMGLLPENIVVVTMWSLKQMLRLRRSKKRSASMTRPRLR